MKSNDKKHHALCVPPGIRRQLCGQVQLIGRPLTQQVGFFLELNFTMQSTLLKEDEFGDNKNTKDRS